MDGPQFALRLVDCLCAALSLCSCIVLTCRIRRLPRAVRCRLFPQQALWLGLADVAYTLAKLVIEHVRFGIGVDLCRHVWFIEMTTNISYLMEMFICLSFAFQAAKCSRGLRLLKCSGVLSLVLGGLVVLTEPWWNYVGNPDRFMCQIVDDHRIDSAFIVLTIACLGTSVCSFVFVLARKDATSDAVHRRVVVRSTAYMVKTVIIVCPVVLSLVLMFTIGLTPMVLDFASLANILQDLNGAANAATYFFLSRYSHRGRSPSTRTLESSGESFNIAFSEEIRVKMFNMESTHSPLEATPSAY